MNPKHATIVLFFCAALMRAAEPRLPRQIPDTTVYDQTGRRLAFYSDLVKGRTVAINFIFTSCTTICPPLTAKFRQLQQELGARVGRDVALISISVDPVTDTPQRLAAFAEQFHAGPGWSFVTGKKQDIDALMRSLGLDVSDKLSHTPMVLVGNDAAHYWTYTFGLSPVATLAQVVRDASAKKPEAAAAPAENAARNYFSDVLLLNQDGETKRFYSDLLDGQIVMINFLFTTCTAACSPMTANLARVQPYLGDKLGNGVRMISISVDPAIDTPAALKAFAEKFHARPGWYFLTGKKENVNWILHRLGGWTEDKNDHSTVLLVGNLVSGEWVKASALMEPAEIAKVIAGIAVPLSPSR